MSSSELVSPKHDSPKPCEFRDAYAILASSSQCLGSFPCAYHHVARQQGPRVHVYHQPLLKPFCPEVGNFILLSTLLIAFSWSNTTRAWRAEISLRPLQNIIWPKELNIARRPATVWIIAETYRDPCFGLAQLILASVQESQILGRALRHD